MPVFDLSKLTAGLSRTWAGYLRDWGRSPRAANHPQTTRYNYLLAAAQLGRYLAEYSPDPDADAAAHDPTEVTRAHAEMFQGWMIDTRSASTAVNKHKCLQQFFRFLVEEQETDRSPMDRIRQKRGPLDPAPALRRCPADAGRPATTRSARWRVLPPSSGIRWLHDTASRCPAGAPAARPGRHCCCRRPRPRPPSRPAPGRRR